MSKISMKTNQMNNQSGNEQVEKTNRIMMWTMPLMSLWIGFMMPVAMCVYWIANSLFSVIQELIAGKILKKDYEAARAAAAERERQEKEEEKRRKEEARLERQRRLEEEKKNRGKKKPGQKKSDSDQPGIRKSDSRVGMRTYARGRAYDPNRFGGVTPYHDPNAPEIPEDAVEQARREKGEQAENALAGEELASALPETSPIEEEKETAALESVSEAIDGSEEELSGEEAEEAEQDESGEEPDEDKSKDPGRIRRVLTMLKWIETTGRSEEDAIAAALFQLGMDRDDVSVEVIERAKSGFLGFGGNPAKVRVSYEVPDEEQTAPAARGGDGSGGRRLRSGGAGAGSRTPEGGCQPSPARG